MFDPSATTQRTGAAPATSDIAPAASDITPAPLDRHADGPRKPQGPRLPDLDPHSLDPLVMREAEPRDLFGEALDELEAVLLDVPDHVLCQRPVIDGLVDVVRPARLPQVLDVETILRNLNPEADGENIEQAVGAKMKLKPGAVILAADDSVVARALIEQGLDAMGLPFVMTKSGKECWDQLNHIAAAAEAEGKTVHDKVALVLTDLEMPEMDGFTLTRNIKSNARFGNMPVVIHSSLSGTPNEEHVKNVRAAAYVAQFSAEDLSRTLRTLLRQ